LVTLAAAGARRDGVARTRTQKRRPEGTPPLLVRHPLLAPSRTGRHQSDRGNLRRAERSRIRLGSAGRVEHLERPRSARRHVRGSKPIWPGCARPVDGGTRWVHGSHAVARRLSRRNMRGRVSMPT